MKIIAFSGLQGCGKDTVCDLACSLRPTYKKLSFADPIREISTLLFGGNVEEKKGEEWKSSIVYKEFTGRKILQLIGTEAFRNTLHSNIWIDVLNRKIEELRSKGNFDTVLISDLRFPNEAQFVDSFGGLRIWIDRPLIQQKQINNHESENYLEILRKSSFCEIENIEERSEETVQSLFYVIDNYYGVY